MVAEGTHLETSTPISESLRRVMREATQAAPGVKLIVARADGLIIAHDLADAQLARRVAAMSASIVGTAQIATADLGQGTFHEASIEAENGRIICVSATPDVIVAALAPKDSNVGLMLLVLSNLSERISELIG